MSYTQEELLQMKKKIEEDIPPRPPEWMTKQIQKEENEEKEKEYKTLQEIEKETRTTNWQKLVKAYKKYRTKKYITKLRRNLKTIKGYDNIMRDLQLREQLLRNLMELIKIFDIREDNGEKTTLEHLQKEHNRELIERLLRITEFIEMRI